ncbi:MAG: hypothetical protein Q7V56_15125 [Gammaproteobacteria bacterium]|nr:hypothetical protein [Gammaproteobacteria bacterium]
MKAIRTIKKCITCFTLALAPAIAFGQSIQNGNPFIIIGTDDTVVTDSVPPSEKLKEISSTVGNITSSEVDALIFTTMVEGLIEAPSESAELLGLSEAGAENLLLRYDKYNSSILEAKEQSLLAMCESWERSDGVDLQYRIGVALSAYDERNNEIERQLNSDIQTVFDELSSDLDADGREKFLRYVDAYRKGYKEFTVHDWGQMVKSSPNPELTINFHCSEE